MSSATDCLALAVDVAPDRSRASVALAGRRDDGVWHVELDEQKDHVSWVAPWIAGLCKANRIRAVVVDGSSPALPVIDELLRLKIKVTVTTAREVAESFGVFFDAVSEGNLRHTSQGQLNTSLAVARKRELMGGFAWSRKNATSDITPIVACTLALWGAQSSKVKRPTAGIATKAKAVVFR